MRKALLTFLVVAGISGLMGQMIVGYANNILSMNVQNKGASEHTNIPPVPASTTVELHQSTINNVNVIDNCRVHFSADIPGSGQIEIVCKLKSQFNTILAEGKAFFNEPLASTCVYVVPIEQTTANAAAPTTNFPESHFVTDASVIVKQIESWDFVNQGTEISGNRQC